MATTTNYNWVTPDDTDLVKDGASAIRTLGSSIDTTVFNNAAAAVAKSLIDAEGDLIVGDAADAVQRLAIGSNGNVLTVDTSVDGKIKWAAPAGGGKVLQVVQDSDAAGFTTSSATFVDTPLSVSITPSSASNKILVFASMPDTRMENGSGATEAYGYYQLLRGATVLQSSLIGFYNFASSSNADFYSSSSFMYLDSPATTSATTYKIQGRLGAGTLNSFIGSATQLNSIIVMEIGA